MVDPFAASTAPEPAVEAQAPLAAAAAGPVMSIGLGSGGGNWSWRDLPQAFQAINNPKRLGSLALVVWIFMVVITLLEAFAGWLGGKVAVLGTTFAVINGILSFAGLSLILAMAAYIGFRSTVGGENAGLKDAANWAQKKVTSVLGTPLAFVGAILAIAVVMAILAGIGKIPYLGPILFGLTMPATTPGGKGGGQIFSSPILAPPPPICRLWSLVVITIK